MARKVKSAKKTRREVEKRDSAFKTEEISQDLDVIFKERWHGAVNIRGIRYQILYSLFRAFDLYQEEDSATVLRLEGIEDVDIVGFHYQNQYIQVKSANESWKWSQLKDPLKGFLPVHRNDANCGFVLAVGFSLTGDIEKLTQLESLSAHERARVENKFCNLCVQAGYSEVESIALLRKFTILSIPEEKIWQELKIVVAETFNLGSEAVETYIFTLVAKFLEWAKDRKIVTRSDLESVRGVIGEALARETEFQAFGQGLIGRVVWVQDASPADFFDGKGTRSGHIVAGLDIVRPSWIEKIDAALNASKICILRSSSGQGKSTLLYRYAYEKRSPENVFILKIAETPEQVELIRNYLQFRASLGLPILLLIDDIKLQTRLWASIAQQCAALGIRVLVTVRDEDWQRFAQESLINYEILEPRLDLAEAQQIFKLLKTQGKVHTSAVSPEWAYEKIGVPYLLIEYVYLITQGRMLEDRLRDQIKQISQQQEDPAKIEILRRTSLAHALGTPVSVEKLLQTISFNTDPQQTLQSLLGEYLQLENGMLTGLHWVRSHLLAQILHEGFPNPTSTALAILDVIPPDNLAAFISNAIVREGINVEAFLAGLVEKAKQTNIETLITFLDGIFEAGERRFFEANRSVFDEAYQSIGTAGPFWLGLDLLPINSLSNNISELIASLGDQGENLQNIKLIASKISSIPRGIELCRNFLSQVCPSINADTLLNSLEDVGILLDWLALAEVNLPIWQDLRENFLTNAALLNLPLTAFCNFAQGLYRYDEYIYRNWFTQNRENIIAYLKLYTDCLELKISDSSVYIEFLPNCENEDKPHQQTIKRLHLLRSALPFCNHYRSKGIWLLPSGLVPSVDDTFKDIDRENLSYELDTKKDVIWRRIVQEPYLPDNYYNYEKGWYVLRSNTLNFVERLMSTLKKVLIGKTVSPSVVYGEKLEVLMEIEESFKFAASSPIKSLEPIRTNLAEPLKIMLRDNIPGKWLVSFRNFFTQVFQYVLSNFQDRESGRLAVHNFKDAIKHLQQMHTAFKQLFQNAPDYFDTAKLNLHEISTYITLSDLLETWIINKTSYFPNDILQYIQASKESKRQEVLQNLQEAIFPLQKSGMNFILPNNIYVDYPLRYLSIAFSVNDPCYPETELCFVIAVINDIKDIAEYFCFIPIYRGKRFLEGSYQISSTQIEELLQGRIEHWETLALRELPEGVWQCLPEIEFCPSPKQQFRASIHGLIGSLDILKRRQAIIEPLQNSKNYFEVALYEKHREKLNNLIQELRNAVMQIQEQLESNFSALKNTQNYVEIKNYLESIDVGLRQNNLSNNLAVQLEGIKSVADQMLTELAA